MLGFAPPAIRFALLTLALVFLSIPRPAIAQGLVESESGLTIEAIHIRFNEPGYDAAIDRRIEDKVRTTIAMFPRERFSREVFDFAMSRARRIPELSDATYDVTFGEAGGVVIDIALTLRKGVPTKDSPRARFPILYDAPGAYVKAKVEALGMYYANNNAWYGRPDALLEGNPLVIGEPAGRGYDAWVESYIHVGLYGIAPINDTTFIYGGGSAISSFSKGQELFTEETRSYAAVEDAYAGIITGRTSDDGDRWILNGSAGRQKFALGDGLLIVNTAANGENRAALQANARWAADFVGLIQFRYNNTTLDLFRIDPDELPILDTKTVIAGINIEAEWQMGLKTAFSYLEVSRSSFGYFLPDGTRLSRDGLRAYDIRGRWQPRPTGAPGPFAAGELAVQENRRFSMHAVAYQGEVGYAFADRTWAPTLSYRFSRFSGDDADTARYERWDPLLSGGNGEQWVQGINHFKVVQDSNLLAHRLQLRLRPHPKFELVPQAWVFRADSPINLGGNPALSFLQSRDYGTEFNITGKMFWSRNLYLHGHVALTFPGRAVEYALGGSPSNWWSSMIFVRYAY